MPEGVGVIYVVRHLATGRVYVGLTTRPLPERWAQHLRDASRPARRHRYFANALVKYGADAFAREIVERAVPRSSLATRERYWIAALRATERGHGFNMTEGGQVAPDNTGRKFSAEWRAALSTAHRGKKHSAEVRQKMGESRRRHYADPAARARLAESHRGRKFSDETRAKISAAHTGRKRDMRFLTEELREKYRAAARKMHEMRRAGKFLA